MGHPIDYLFTLPTPELATLLTLIDSINCFASGGSVSTKNLVDKIENYRIENPSDRETSDVANTITQALIETLKNDKSVLVLLDKLEDFNYFHYRTIIITIIGWFGQSAEIAVPKLIHFASGSGAEVEAAKRAILLIGNAEPIIMSALSMSVATDDDGEFRELCDLARRVGSSNTDDFLNILKTAARSGSPHMREVVADAIGKLDATRKRQMTTVIEQLRVDEDENVRQAAIDIP